MKVLLDTHAFLWWVTDDQQLPSHAREIIADADELFLSAASGWEMAIKASLGKLVLPANVDSYISEQVAVNAITPLPVQMSHALRVYSLPYHHKDPFDCLLIAQAQMEDLTILTNDAQIVRYPVKTIW